jgi:hypothetical protein
MMRRPIDRTEIAVRVGPLVPDRHAAFAKIANVGIAAQEPQQLADDGAQMQALGRQHWKAPAEIEAHLMAEEAASPGARAIGFHCAAVAHAA